MHITFYKYKNKYIEIVFKYNEFYIYLLQKIKLNPDEVFKAIIYPNWTKESLTDDPKVEAFMKIANDSKIQQK